LIELQHGFLQLREHPYSPTPTERPMDRLHYLQPGGSGPSPIRRDVLCKLKSLDKMVDTIECRFNQMEHAERIAQASGEEDPLPRPPRSYYILCKAILGLAIMVHERLEEYERCARCMRLLHRLERLLLTSGR
jgi:hypothetical protein